MSEAQSYGKSHKLRLACLTQGVNIPSTRFRLLQYVDSLEGDGIKLQHLPAKFGAYPPKGVLSRFAWFPLSLADSFGRSVMANNSNVCFLQRELISTLYTAECLVRSTIIFDVDDAIFLHSRSKYSDKIAQRASVVICGNSYIADHYSRLAKTIVLPTAVDTERFFPVCNKLDKPIIGWSGSSSGLPYLYEIEDALDIVLQLIPDAELGIVCDAPPSFRKIPPNRVQFIRWSPENEVRSIQKFNVGIMPLDDTSWSKGKCSFKMLTYMAVGVPVVVSPVGMNVEVLAHGSCGFSAKHRDDWVDAICTLINNKTLSNTMGGVGRSIVETFYSKKKIGSQLSKIIFESANICTACSK